MADQKNKREMPTREELFRIGMGRFGESIFLSREDSAKAAIKPSGVTREQLLRIGVNKAGESIFLNQEEASKAAIGRKEIDPEIQKLTKTVMEAAAGKPLKISITEQRRQQQIVESFIMQFRERQLSEGQEGESSVQKAPEGNSAAPSPSSNSSSKPDSNPVTTDDLAGIQKSIEKLSSGLAQESK